MKNTIRLLGLASLLFLLACSSSEEQQKNSFTGELFLSGNVVYLTDCSTGIKYEVTGNITELISGAKDRITEGDNQVFARIQADSLGSDKLQFEAIEAFLDQPPAACDYHMGFLSTLAETQWSISAEEKNIRVEMGDQEWVLTVDGEEILFPPVNARITNKFLEYDSSTLWNDNQSFMRIAIMPRACENESGQRYFYSVITLDNELIKACARIPSEEQ